jgi:hypothetical protein
MHLQGLDEDEILTKLVTEAEEADTRDKRGLSGVSSRLNIRTHAAPRGGSPQRGGGRRGGPPPPMPARRTALRYIYTHTAASLHPAAYILHPVLHIPEHSANHPPCDMYAYTLTSHSVRWLTCKRRWQALRGAIHPGWEQGQVARALGPCRVPCKQR